LERVPEIIGLKSEEILFMDDRQVNIDRAKSIGYIAILCDNSNKDVKDYLKKVGVEF
jgi:methionine salvage enolase-phosphatase E1